MGQRLFVGNLAYGTSEQTLRGLFDNGTWTVREVKIITDRETGRSRGFGFVELGDDASAQSAIEQLDGVELEGRRLAVREAYERPGRNNGGSRGGGPPRGRVGGKPDGGGGGPPSPFPPDGGGPPPMPEDGDRRARGGGRKARRRAERRAQRDEEEDDW